MTAPQLQTETRSFDKTTTTLGAVAGLLKGLETFLPEQYKVYSQVGLGLTLAVWGFFTNHGKK